MALSCDRTSVGFVARRLVKVEAVSHSADIRSRAKQSLEIGAILTVPMVRAGELIGAITCERRNGQHFDEATVALLEDVGVLVGPLLDLERDTERSGFARLGNDLATLLRKIGGREHRRVKVLLALKELGVRISIDDFGTGFSSLAYLKVFPADTLKIDRSFASGLPGNMKDASITCAIIDLSSRLGMTVVAEGVETVEQLHYLAQAGCREVQGFLFARPMEPHLLENLWFSGKPLAPVSP